MKFILGKFIIEETLAKTPVCSFDGQKIEGVVRTVHGVTKALIEVDNSFNFDEELLKQNNILIKRV